MSSNAEFDVIQGLDVSVVLSPVSGDLRVRGWDREQLSIRSERVAVNQKEDSNDFTVTGTGDTRLSLPHRAKLMVGPVAGDARITDLANKIVLNNISGDLILRDVGPVSLTNVSADLRIRRVDGDLKVQNIGSDATVREISGDVHIESVGADLFISDVAGSCMVEQVGSDLVLSMPFYPDNTYSFRAGADVVCRVPPESSVRFLLPLEATVNVKADDAEMVKDETHKVVTFGDGEAEVTIEAGGEIRFAHSSDQQDEGLRFNIGFDFDFDFDDRLTESLSSIESRLAEQLAHLDEQLSVTIARQTEKMQKRAERLRQQAEKRAERLQRAAERQREKNQSRTWSASWGAEPPRPPKPPTPPPPESEPVSDEERLTVLRMLENGQISVEEAERLLAALEGRSK